MSRARSLARADTTCATSLRLTSSPARRWRCAFSHPLLAAGGLALPPELLAAGTAYRVSLGVLRPRRAVRSRLRRPRRTSQDDIPVSHFPGVPFVKKMEYKAMKVDDDDYITVLTDDGDTRPIKVSPVALELSNKIKEMLKKEIDFYVIVQQACGKEQIMDIKIAASGGSGVDFFDDKD